MRKVATGEQITALVRTIAAGRAPSGEPSLTRLGTKGPFTRYEARLRWTAGAPTIALIALRSDGPDAGQIGGLTVRPDEPGPERYDRYETKARLKLPFSGTWTAHNAARASTNPHFTNPNQRFAVDWIRHGPDGKNLSHGSDALAVAAATVVTVIDGVPENPPGKTDLYNVTGNSVVLDLGGGEFALYAHLVPGSIRVKPGERVAVGQVLGKIGNSGNSTEAHLHFQLMDAPRLTDAAALLAAFVDVAVNGKRVARALPDEGQTFSP
jgi:murein DD-endopeptidase MepM/ murein hydrolase activator NlpD